MLIRQIKARPQETLIQPKQHNATPHQLPPRNELSGESAASACLVAGRTRWHSVQGEVILHQHLHCHRPPFVYGRVEHDIVSRLDRSSRQTVGQPFVYAHVRHLPGGMQNDAQDHCPLHFTPERLLRVLGLRFQPDGRSGAWPTPWSATPRPNA
jgi:hypothetical protein